MDRPYTVAFDATPLAAPVDSTSSHTMRGIGRYMRGLLDAVVAEQPDWAAHHLRPVVTRAQELAAANTIATRRTPWRTQDVGWWTGWAADRFAIRGRRPDLWHGLDPTTPLSPLPASRTLMTAYDLIAVHEPSSMAQMRAHRRAVYRLYLRRLRGARMVIAISETTAADVHATLGVPLDRIRVVYPAIAATEPLANPAVQAAAAPDLLFVGVPEPTKQPEAAIAALAECRGRGLDVRLRFAGYQRPADRARLEAAAQLAGVASWVDFLGRVSDDALLELYRSSVLLAVSRIEGFGLPPVESVLSSGRVVCGSAPVYREVLGTAATFARSDLGTDLADAYEQAAAKEPGPPPAELVERYSPRSVAASLVGAYTDAL